MIVKRKKKQTNGLMMDFLMARNNMAKKSKKFGNFTSRTCNDLICDKTRSS